MRIFLVLLIIFSTITADARLQYPSTRKADTADSYFGTKIADPYRCPENDNSEETKAFRQRENKVAHGLLEKITFRENFRHS
jgi:prolyl oligopeptidase